MCCRQGTLRDSEIGYHSDVCVISVACGNSWPLTFGIQRGEHKCIQLIKFGTFYIIQKETQTQMSQLILTEIQFLQIKLVKQCCVITSFSALNNDDVRSNLPRKLAHCLQKMSGYLRRRCFNIRSPYPCANTTDTQSTTQRFKLLSSPT